MNGNLSKNKLLNAIVELIEELDKAEIIDAVDVVDRLQIEKNVIVVLRPEKRNHNVATVVDAMLEADKVFLTDINSRQQLSYLKRRVEDESGLRVKVQEAVFDKERGYLFSFENDPDDP